MMMVTIRRQIYHILAACITIQYSIYSIIVGIWDVNHLRWAMIIVRLVISTVFKLYNL